jgi:simple sugar transport system permease protein
MVGIILSLIMATLRQAAPILITAIGGMICEVSGVVNIGLEGMMLMGAFFTAITSYYTGSWFLGLIGGIVGGGLVAGLHALISIKYKGNQVVSGVAINLFATGFTVFMLRVLFKQSSNTPTVEGAPTIFGVSIIIYIIYAIALLATVYMNRTVGGLRLRAVGEYPLAADTVGINVEKVRYKAVILSGALAGIGGAYLSIGALSQFTKEMSSGRGFIALAAIVFGKWKIKGVIMASLLFGFADASQNLVQQYFPFIPSQLIQMAPYVLTLLALSGVVGKAVAPKASGKPYDKDNL